MKGLIITVLIVLISISMFAQGWSNDPSSPNLVFGGDGEQVMPKIAIDSAGNSFMTVFDNSSGGYQVWIQKFSPGGSPLFNLPSGNLVSSNPCDTWLTDYDLTVDQDDNALVTFQDIRNVTNNVVVYKIGGEFAQLWGANGISLSNDTTTDYSNNAPKVLNTSLNNTYVAWMHSGTGNGEIRIQKLNPEGQLQWAEGGLIIANLAASCTWPQLLETDNGDILMKYYQDSGPFWAPTRHIYVCRINPAGQIVWNNPVSTAGGISAWNQIIGFEQDGSGGAVLAWYDDRNNDMVNEVYASRITSQGWVTMDTNGSLVTTATGNQQYNPQIAVDTAEETVYVFYKITDANQNNNSLGAQQLDYSGVRQWSDAGIQLEGLSLHVIMPHYACVSDAGVICVYGRGDVPSSDATTALRVRCLDTQGASVWESDYQFLASNSTSKLHYDFDSFGSSWFAGIWEQGTSSNDSHAMRMNSDGSLGQFYAPPQNLSAEVIGHDITLTWQAPVTDLPLQRYYIYYNGFPLPDNPGLNTSWTYTDWTPQTGSFYVKARYLDGSDSAPSNTVTITIVANEDEVLPAIADQMQVYPNPLHNSAAVRWFSSKAASAVLTVYNMKGQKLESRSIEAAKASWNETLWNASAYANGIYLLRLQTGTQVLNHKVMILK